LGPFNNSSIFSTTFLAFAGSECLTGLSYWKNLTFVPSR